MLFKAENKEDRNMVLQMQGRLGDQVVVFTKEEIVNKKSKTNCTMEKKQN